MNIKFARKNHQLLLSAAVLASAIIPMTSAVAILPMGSEIFPTKSSAAVFSNETAWIIEEALSKEEHLKIEQQQLTAFSKKSEFATLIRESKQFKGIEKHNSDILDN